jgi:hypothetical protein
MLSVAKHLASAAILFRDKTAEETTSHAWLVMTNWQVLSHWVVLPGSRVGRGRRSPGCKANHQVQGKNQRNQH